MEKSIIIIGAGIAGLSAGCYGQMNDYKTQIFEMHDQPGGLCTSWKRKGYTFDGCIHWLIGSRPGNSFHRTWQELGAVQGRDFVHHDAFLRIQDSNGQTLILYTDPDRLEQHMKTLSPQDSSLIEELCEGVRVFSRFTPPTDKPRELCGPLDGVKIMVKMLPFMRAFGKYGKTMLQDFAARFRDPFLRQAIRFSLYFDQDSPLFALLFTLAEMHNRNAGYPVGGSLALAQAIERRYLDLGGEIHYRSRVDEILVESGEARGRSAHDRVVGVRLSDGARHQADLVVSAADGRTTIFDMLGGKYADEEIHRRYETWPVCKPAVQVSLGVARDFSDEPHMVTYLLDEPIVVAGEAHRHLSVRHYCCDPTMAPPGKSVIQVLMGSNHRYWKDAYEERERYQAEKQQVALAVIDQMERRFPGFTGAVEAVDVATPVTTERYTGNWQGSIMAWATTTETMGREQMSRTLPGLENFYMIGQWVEGGGLPPVATSGRDVIRVVCHEDGRAFETRLP
jgi:phytoene dehydrogenase-like protein